MSLRGVLRWLAATDPVENLVVYCDHVPAPPVGKADVRLRWQGCVRDLDAASAAQLLVQGASYLQILSCEHGSPLQRLRAVLGDLASPYNAPARPARKAQTIDMATVQLPRRSLLPTPSDSALTVSASNAWRTFEAFHNLAEAHAIFRPTDFSAADALHAVRCASCNSLIGACPANEAREFTAREAAANFTALCPACQVAVHYCPARSKQDFTSAAMLAPFEGKQADTEDLVACAKCKNPHPAAEGKYCRMCAYRMQHPFTAVMPEKALAALPEDVRRQLRGI